MFFSHLLPDSDGKQHGEIDSDTNMCAFNLKELVPFHYFITATNHYIQEIGNLQLTTFKQFSFSS
jgi:hypothetical protein